MSGSSANKRRRPGKAPVVASEPILSEERDWGDEYESDNEGVASRVIPPRVVFPWLSKTLPRTPAVRATRARLTPEITNPGQISENNYFAPLYINFQAHRAALIDGRLAKNGAPEKRFLRDNTMPAEILAIYDREQLGRWFSILGDYCSSDLTREILVNSRFWNCGESKDERFIFCRGKFIVLTPDTINEALGCPPLSEPCAYFSQLSDPNCVKEVSLFCFGREEGPWEMRGSLPQDRVQKTTLLRRARWICELLENWVLGVTQQREYTFKLCTLAYCLWRGKRIDIPWFIYESIMERRDKDCQKGPGHTWLFLAMARRQGVNLEGLRLDISKDPDRAWAKIPDPTENLPPPPRRKGKGVAGVSNESIMREIRANRLAQDRQFEHVRSNQRKLGALLETIGQWHLSAAEANNVTLNPPAPQTQPWYQSDGYDYDAQEPEPDSP